MTSFLKRNNWSIIERGFEYNAAMLYPSDTKRPLSFFVPDDDNVNKGTIINDIGDFSPEITGNRRKAKEQKIVMTIKPRRVVVISNDEINQLPEFEYILVAPINTIKSYEKSKEWYTKLKEDNHPIFTYLPSNSFERYVDLSQIVSIHKSLLLEKFNSVSAERMEVIEQDLLMCLALGIIDEETLDEFDIANK